MFKWIKSILSHREPVESPAFNDENANYTPRVIREDVLRIIGREFPADDPTSILQLLDQYGTEAWHPERERVHAAILKISSGDLEQLRQYVKVAQSDFRDVISPAEYPTFFGHGFDWSDKLPEEDAQRITKQEWDDYHEWLNRE